MINTLQNTITQLSAKNSYSINLVGALLAPSKNKVDDYDTDGLAFVVDFYDDDREIELAQYAMEKLDGELGSMGEYYLPLGHQNNHDRAQIRDDDNDDDGSTLSQLQEIQKQIKESKATIYELVEYKKDLLLLNKKKRKNIFSERVDIDSNIENLNQYIKTLWNKYKELNADYSLGN